MWNARTKDELMIEVWEKLDCESVGSSEIETIEVAVASVYGNSAIDSPMIVARLLAEEGAELRHSEIMTLYVERVSDRPYNAALRGILRFHDIRSARSTIRDLENLRKKYEANGDSEALRLLRDTVLKGKREVNMHVESPKTEALDRQINIEISQWLSHWLQTPKLFESWVSIREGTSDFVDKFGRIAGDEE